MNYVTPQVLLELDLGDVFIEMLIELRKVSRCKAP
jgi:hypothetical protein